MIKGGYVLKPRKIKHSDIYDASPCVRETWDYLIREANHEEYKRGTYKIKRGQLFRSYQDIIDDLCWYVGWRKETYSEDQMKKAMKFLRDTERITTKKAPGGVLITVCNYSFYQDPDNYESTNESTEEGTIDAPSAHHRRTTHSYKNEKNDKNDKKSSVSTSGTDFPDVCKFLDEAKQLANHLQEKIIEWEPSHRYASNPPSLNSWIIEIERAIRLDNRTPDELELLIDYIFTQNTEVANFWKPNIQSGKKLRDKFDQLVGQIKNEINRNGQAEKTRGDKFYDKLF